MALDKKTLAAVCKDKRLLHVLKHRPQISLPSTMHGYAIGRRSESAQLVQQCFAWRLRRLRMSSVSMRHDLTNALAVPEVWRDEDVSFGVQQVEWASTTIAASDGDLDLRIGQGGPMGDPFVVQRSARTFVRPVCDWQMRQSAWDPCSKGCIARCVL